MSASCATSCGVLHLHVHTPYKHCWAMAVQPIVSVSSRNEHPQQQQHRNSYRYRYHMCYLPQLLHYLPPHRYPLPSFLIYLSLFRHESVFPYAFFHLLPTHAHLYTSGLVRSRCSFGVHVHAYAYYVCEADCTWVEAIIQIVSCITCARVAIGQQLVQLLLQLSLVHLICMHAKS